MRLPVADPQSGPFPGTTHGAGPADRKVPDDGARKKRRSMSPEQDTVVASSEKPAGKARGTIARRLAVGFGSVSVVAIAMCVMLISLIAEVSGLVMDMRGDEAAIKESLTLAMAVREQYMHQAHWLIERDDEHLDHSGEWLDRVERGVRVLRPLVPTAEHQRLDGVATDSRALDDLFRVSIRPAAKRGDMDAVSREHRRAQQVSQRASDRADAIARAVERRMANSHVSATRATRLGLFGGGFCILLVLALSVGHTLRLRQLVLRPLSVLSNAARRFGAGDFETRLGNVGDGELGAVAEAFDRMAEELEAREKRLVASERMAAIGQLAAGVAHEINNPIGIIRGYLKTIGPDSTPEAFQEELAILDEEAAACQRIAEDLVAFSRAPELRCEATAMGQLLEETVRRFRESPDCGSGLVQIDAQAGDAFADAVRIRQVLLNLLINGVQVSGTESEVDVSGRVLPGGGYEVTVSDRGPGVAPKDQTKIFEPFFSKRKGGSGLGLAVCQGIVRAHGGAIHVEERPGGGTTFRFAIPGSHQRDEVGA